MWVYIYFVKHRQLQRYFSPNWMWSTHPWISSQSNCDAVIRNRVCNVQLNIKTTYCTCTYVHTYQRSDVICVSTAPSITPSLLHHHRSLTVYRRDCWMKRRTSKISSPPAGSYNMRMSSLPTSQCHPFHVLLYCMAVCAIRVCCVSLVWLCAYSVVCMYVCVQVSRLAHPEMQTCSTCERKGRGDWLVVTHACTHAHAHTHTTHMHAHTHRHAHTHMYIHTHRDTQTHNQYSYA